MLKKKFVKVNFGKPLDWRGMRLLDYPRRVARPMDLGTVQRKISEMQYVDAHDFAADMRLIFTNCLAFNTDPENDVRACGINLSARFEQLWGDAFGAPSKRASR